MLQWGQPGAGSQRVGYNLATEQQYDVYEYILFCSDFFIHECLYAV